MSVLMAAPGAVAFYESCYGISLSGSTVTDWAPRIGSETLSGAGAARPTYSGNVQNGKTGVTFDGTNQYIHKGSSTLAALLDGSQAYSSLIVAKTAGGATKAVWSAGAQATSEYVREGVNSGADWRVRRTNASGSATNTGTGAVGTTNPFLITNVYTGSAYNGFTNGVQTLTTGANTRAPTCDIFSIGAGFESGSANYRFDGPIWCVLISTSQWSAAERQALERAANAYYGLGLTI